MIRDIGRYLHAGITPFAFFAGLEAVVGEGERFYDTSGEGMTNILTDDLKHDGLLIG